MPILLLLYLVLVCSPVEWPAPPLDYGPVGSTVATVVLLGAVVARSVELGRLTRRRLLGDPLNRAAVLRAYHRGRGRQQVVLMVAFAVALGGLGWGWTVRSVCSRADQSLLPGAELVLIGPFVLSLLLSWAGFYSADRTATETAWGPEPPPRPFDTRARYVMHLARQNLAMIGLPAVMLVVEQALLRWKPELFGEWWLQAALIATVVAFLPWAMRLLLGLKPLPPGPVRDRLWATVRRLKFRCTNLLQWDTRDTAANAMVAGLLPWPRYVLFTDRLLDELSPEELESVLGHEVGHVKHGHMYLYGAFFLLSVFTLGALAGRLERVWPGWADAVSGWQYLPGVAIIGLYTFVVFGFLSRRCERQADVYGCRAVSCGRPDCPGHDADAGLPLAGRGLPLCATGIETFVTALEKVARANGISRDKAGWLASWQHSTIARRVEFLQQVGAVPAIERQFQKRLRLLKWSLLVTLATVLILLTTFSPA